jgi:hypothetical protein
MVSLENYLLYITVLAQKATITNSSNTRTAANASALLLKIITL